jgi:Domain of unknown function (DUF6702)
MMLNFLLANILLFLFQIHPFHVSVCDVNFNAEAKSIQISQRLFLDDFEKALNKKFDINLVIDDISTKSYRDSLIQVYLFDNLHLLVDGKEKKRVFVGSEIEENAMWCYFEYLGVKKFRSLKINSTILLETFEDQANIIHFTSGTFEKSIKLDKLKTSGSFKPEL